MGPWHHKAITIIFLTDHFSMLSASGIFQHQSVVMHENGLDVPFHCL